MYDFRKIDRLTPRELAVLQLRYGSLQEKGLLSQYELKGFNTLGDVAQQFDVSRERICQIIKKALKKLEVEIKLNPDYAIAIYKPY